MLLSSPLYSNIVHIVHTKKHEIMGNLLYVVAVILIILWAIGFIGYNAGAIIHILLVIALIAVLFRIIQGKKQR